ncbi:MAG: DASS family sodium-coupled anion symporter [Chromatiales bacterium]|nr:DASS family sodium-coupled anion symporter [Gammaproteobacteria bacterium]MBW6476608.1 DASS family sodium-coupled anion symporter [Chromatiales bacterium]
MPSRQLVGLLLGPLLFAILFLMPLPEGMSSEARAVAAVTLLMATWWIGETMPMAATALLPVVLFPLLGVMSTGETTSAYANPLIFLFLGGFMLAMTMQKWNMHRRIALHTLRLVGTRRERIILGFMLATAGLSMWISNTATALMMLPIALAVIANQQQQDGVADRDFATSLMLAIAWSASIGGVATLIGSPPNAILAGFLERMTGTSIGFAQWMGFALPLSVIMLALAWLYLHYFSGLRPQSTGQSSGDENARLIAAQLAELGPMRREEKHILMVFLCVATGWILPGLISIPWLAGVGDASIAIAGALALFLIPSSWQQRRFLLDWRSAVALPWDILLLFGGGFALAYGFESSGMTEWTVSQLGALHGIPPLVLILAVSLVVIFLTGVTSNTATATIVLPIVGALALAMGLPASLLMIPAAIAASYAFMLPVGTPPNAIVFAGGHLSIMQMARTGFWLNLIAAGVVSLFVWLFAPGW